MEYIFEHEQLRIDELVRKINAKNSFTPLKPLRTLRLQMRRSTIQTDQRAKNIPDGSSSNKKCNIRSISPVFKIDSEWKQRTLMDFAIWNTPKSDQCLGSVVEHKVRALPEIAKPRGFYAKEFGKKEVRKNSQNFVAYVPTVLFLKNQGGGVLG